MKTLMQILLLRLFGQKPVTNLQIFIPKFKSSHPTNRPTEKEWSNEFKVGSRYGHRGSFYNKN
jgi:hypothetical protein